MAMPKVCPVKRGAIYPSRAKPLRTPHLRVENTGVRAYFDQGLGLDGPQWFRKPLLYPTELQAHEATRPDAEHPHCFLRQNG